MKQPNGGGNHVCFTSILTTGIDAVDQLLDFRCDFNRHTFEYISIEQKSKTTIQRRFLAVATDGRRRRNILIDRGWLLSFVLWAAPAAQQITKARQYSAARRLTGRRDV